jgi:pimeloyl-ACP methyl ester carboxylesterase
MGESIEKPRVRSDPVDSGFQLVPPRMIDSGQVKNDGLSIYYETTENPDADAVVFIEGWGTGRWIWRWQRQALADHFRTILLDNRGTGRSETPSGPGNLAELLLERTGRWWTNWLSLYWSLAAVTPWTQWLTPIDRPFTISDMAGDLEAVLTELNIREAHIVGASMGGMIALQHALEYDRVKTLTLLGSTPGGSAAVAPTARVQALAATSASHCLDRAELRQRTRVAMSDEFIASHPDLVERILDWRQKSDATPRGRFLQAVAATAFDVGEQLTDIHVPVHVLHGTEDTILPAENGRILAERLPNAEYTPIEGGSHFFFIEQSEKVNETLVEFFDEHATG